MESDKTFADHVLEAVKKQEAESQKKLPGHLIYDEIPQKLRIQINHIFDQIFQFFSRFIQSDFYIRLIVESLRIEFGLEKLANIYKNNSVFFMTRGYNYYKELKNHIKEEDDVKKFVITLEIVCNHIKAINKELMQNYSEFDNNFVSNLLNELNIRIRQNQFGYEYNIEQEIFQRIDTPFLHDEIVKPVMELLTSPEFKTAEDDLKLAFKHFNEGKYPDAITNAHKAFESTLKIICFECGWPFEYTASKLIATILEKNLIEIYWQDHFSNLNKILETSISPTRNQKSAHGQGPNPAVIPDHLVGYILHLTASCIIFLIKSYQHFKSIKD